VIEKIKSIFNDKDFEEILKKGFSFLLIRIGGLLAGYIFTYLIAINYGAETNGLIAISFAIILCVSIFSRLGIDINLIRFFSTPENENDKGLFFRVIIIAFVLSSLFSILLYLNQDFLINRIFKKPNLKPYFLWIALTIPLWTTVLICSGLFRAKKKNNWFGFFNNTGRFSFALLVFVFFLFFYEDPISVIVAHFLGILLLAIFSFILSCKLIDKVTLKTKAETFKFIKNSFPMMISEAILLLLIMADILILGVYENEDVVGVYNVTYKIAVLTIFSLQAINSILAPKIAKSYHEKNYKLCQKLITFSTNLNFCITICVVSTIIIFNKTILSFFGEEFLTGSMILIILCVGQLINSLSGSVGVILQMTGCQKAYQNIILIALVINVILNFYLTPKHGALGAATATVFSLAFWNITGAVYLKKKLNIISYFRIKKFKSLIK